MPTRTTSVTLAPSQRPTTYGWWKPSAATVGVRPGFGLTRRDG